MNLQYDEHETQNSQRLRYNKFMTKRIREQSAWSWRVEMVQ